MPFNRSYSWTVVRNVKGWNSIVKSKLEWPVCDDMRSSYREREGAGITSSFAEVEMCVQRWGKSV